MINQIKTWWNEKPLAVILCLGLLFRLLAAFFSKGFGMSDDHFYIIEAVHGFADHVDYDHWFPSATDPGRTPIAGHNFFYTGIIYALFEALKFIGVNDPQDKMTVLRLLQAVYSLITVYYGYKIAYKLSTPVVAKQVGLLLAILWLMPFLSVRNLVEVVCIPPMIYATWLAVKDDTISFGRYLLIGILLGFAFNIRYQTMLFTGGFGLALLFKKRITPAIAVGIGFALCAGIIQGGVDMLIWKRPFADFIEYLRFNSANAHNFIDGPWYKYFLLIGGILIPPISLFLLFGYFRGFRKYLILFLPAFVFLVFHSYFPNKQERFILPIVPFIIILGCIGWADFVSVSTFWQKRPSLLRTCWIFVWIVNIAPLLVVSVSYSKRNRVEAMTYLRSKGDVTNLLIDNSNRDFYLVTPWFYLDKWPREYGVTSKEPIDMVYKYYCQRPLKEQPNYLILYQPDNIDKRLAAIKRYHTLKYETTIQPSFIDWLVHWLNPINDNQTTYIYKIVGNIVPCDSTQVK